MFSNFYGGPHYTGFDGLALLCLFAGAVALVVFGLLFLQRWWVTHPRMPDAAPDTTDLRDEPPAVANMLVNRYKVTSTAIPATLIDLAARRVLGIDLVGHDNYVVRIRDGDSREKLTDYERQVFDLVKSRATGGSCPVEALDLGEAGQADRFKKRFTKRVRDDAKARGLVRNRWRPGDWVVIGVGLAVPLALLASAFALAHLGETQSSSGWSQSDWFKAAGGLWLAAMVALTRTQDLRETAAGSAAAAHWLGVRNYFRHNHAFEHAQAAAVVLWERNLAYGVATGAAHEATHDIPMVAEDPDEAWSRYGGMWRQVRVHYPKGFGYGESPGKVAFGGLWRVILWGGLCFIALPFLLSVVLDVLNSDITTNTSSQRNFELGAIVAITVIFGGAAIYLFVRFAAGAFRLWRGLSDMRADNTYEGMVVKVHEGRAAVDDGHADELAAFMPCTQFAHIDRGTKVRVTSTPHLHFVRTVEVLERPALTTDEAADAQNAANTAALGKASEYVSPMALPDLTALVQEVAGSTFVPGKLPAEAGNLGPFAQAGMVQTFSDGSGSIIAITRIHLDLSGAMGAMMGFLAKRMERAMSNAQTPGAVWMRDTDLMLRSSDGMTYIHCDVKGRSSQDREKIARAIADRLPPMSAQSAATPQATPPAAPAAPAT